MRIFEPLNYIERQLTDTEIIIVVHIHILSQLLCAMWVIRYQLSFSVPLTIRDGTVVAANVKFDLEPNCLDPHRLIKYLDGPNDIQTKQ